MISPIQAASHSVTQKSYRFDMIRVVKVIYTYSNINSADMYVLGVCLVGLIFFILVY